MRKIALVCVLCMLFALPYATQGQEEMTLDVASETIEIESDGLTYESYLAAPTEGGPYPGIVLIHSFNGLEPGYETMTDHFAAEGFVVLAVGWQENGRQPSNAVMEQLLLDSIDTLTARDDVDPERLGLTGFCAGGRYTMRFLPTVEAFGAGVAWYGFPYSGDEESPANFIDQLEDPMLIIHPTEDRASAIEDIYQYAGELTAAGKSFELKVYSDEGHGFMIEGGELRTDDVANDAFDEMVRYFQRKLG